MNFVLAVLVVSTASAVAQPRIGVIEVYGARKVSKAKILRELGVNPGDLLPRSKGDVEERLEAIDGVLRARLEAFCCDAGKPILYVGIEERGAPVFALKEEPSGELTLPGEIVEAYREFADALARAARDGDVAEDLSAGHSLMENIACRRAQQRLLGLAELHEATLRRVLKESADPEQRTVAAYVIGYAPDKRKVIADLQAAVQDPSEEVRANAARGLRAIAVLARKDPEQKLRVTGTWFVEMLHSTVLSDRLLGANVLEELSESRDDENLLINIRERGMVPLQEMARWHHLPHAVPAFLILGRVAGWKEQDIEAAWASGEREKALEKMFRK